MAARVLLLSLGADLRQAWRRAHSRGPASLATAVGAGLALVTAEVWIVHRLGTRLQLLPEAVRPVTDLLLLRTGHLIGQLAMMVAGASSISLALPILEEAEGDPWLAACPLPAPARALQSAWRVLAGIAWVVLLALPPMVTAGLFLRPDPWAVGALAAGTLLLVGTAACAGMVVALVLAALVPRRLLVPLSWSATTGAVVAAVLWLRHLHPERLITESDPLRLLSGLAALGDEGLAGPAGWVIDVLRREPGLWKVASLACAAVAALVALWPALAPRAAFRLTSGSPSQRRPSGLWRVVDRHLGWGGVGPLVRSRARLLVRDTTQAAQALYLLGLGVVYVENLRSLPLDEPLARELAGLVNLAMAGLLAAALALRFAFPAQVMEGSARWWWAAGPVSRRHAGLAAFAVAVLPPLLLTSTLFAASLAVTGPSRAVGAAWWLVPWWALWLTAVGVAVGPSGAVSGERSWLDVALGGGGLGFLACSLGAVGWTVVAAGRQVIAEVLWDLGVSWSPGILTAHAAVPAAVLTGGAAALIAWQFRSG